MARDALALNIKKWGATGNASVFQSLSSKLQNSGFTRAFSFVGGERIQISHFNVLLRNLTALAFEINSKGVLEWSNAINYVVNAFVVYNGKIYKALVVNGPATSNDTIPGTDDTIWKVEF